MKVGTYGIPFLLIGLYSFLEKKTVKDQLKNFRFISVLMLCTYILHQFEEHWIDIYGNYYAFYTFNNDLIRSALGESDMMINPLTKESVYVINTSLVWLVGFLAIWRSPKHLFPLFAMGGIILVNAFVHIVAGMLKWTYNPGLLTSILVFVPVYIWFAMYIHRRYPAYKKQLIFGILWAFLAHIIMVTGIMAANYFYLIPELLYFIVLVLWSLLPVWVFNKK
ncbi:MAG: HXXEE domain-containing protein [Bacteroidota bacterium]